MALNKAILKKIKVMTESEPEIGNFLVSLLEFESETPGWWKPRYGILLENACKVEKKDENN